MNNYQLYRTNVLLGGQVCWDIVLTGDGNQSIVEDFHITPVNRHIPFSFLPGRYDVGYTHQYNVKKLYEEIIGNFYQGYVDPVLDNLYPITITKGEKKFNTHVQTYEMGCNRVEVGTYGKQFEFLCPLWLEKVAPDDTLVFYINIFNTDVDQLYSKTALRLAAPKVVTDRTYIHNSFVNYLKHYLAYTGIDKGNDNLIKVNLSDKTSFLQGLEVSSGNVKVVEINSLAQNILSRERPLMEVDSMIINLFKQTTSIAPQLFNFRFLFNPADVLSPYLIEMIDFGKFRIGMDVVIEHADGTKEKLELKDFYDNYDYIPKQYCAPKHTPLPMGIDEAPNVFDYLHDNKYIDTIGYNRMYSSILHWSIVGQNNYIFNVYEGFSGFGYKYDGGNFINAHQYGKQVDINSNNATNGSLLWCNCLFITNKDVNLKPSDVNISKRIENNQLVDIDVNELMHSMIDYSITANSPILHVSDTFGHGVDWLNNIRYRNSDNIEGNINVCLGLATAGAHNAIKNQRDTLSEDIKYYKNGDFIFLYFSKPGLNTLLIISKNPRDLIFNNVKLYTKGIIIGSTANIDPGMMEAIKLFNKILNTAETAPVVTFNNSILIHQAPGPSLSSEEIEYYKANNISQKYLLRYDGKIKPTFLSTQESDMYNYFYYKQIINPSDLSDRDSMSGLDALNQYSQLSYPPLYPSIGFYYIKNMPMNHSSEGMKAYESYLFTPERKWYNNSIIMVCRDSYEVTVDFEYINVTAEDFIANLNDTLRKQLGLDDDEMEFIKTKYEYVVVDEYIETIDNLKHHIYQVKLNIK